MIMLRVLPGYKGYDLIFLLYWDRYPYRDEYYILIYLTRDRTSQ